LLKSKESQVVIINARNYKYVQRKRLQASPKTKPASQAAPFQVQIIPKKGLKEAILPDQ